ncbi:hypothetical protein [Pseudomonas syringae]|uniref:hypothetical protein n=1 Tax=Pseudomonas syringae TaxID=317 RepID=UPI001F0D67BA|nr:hypothetical protein [Pseudomonas syringae]MCH5521521.1 hypothetical protein [Pseudomonas syringae pv. lapsa]
MEDYKSAVDAAFKARSERIAAAEKKKLRVKNEQNEFLEKFQIFQDSIVMPIFEEFGRHYARDNDSFSIQKNQGGKRNETDSGQWVRFVFAPKGFENVSVIIFPYLEVRANKDKLLVELHEALKPGKDPEASKLVTEVKIEAADASLLQSHLVRVVREILG